MFIVGALLGGVAGVAWQAKALSSQRFRLCSNTLSRLLNDDRPEDVVADWQHDVDARKLPALRSFLTS
jgi:hypothetical protein